MTSTVEDATPQAQRDPETARASASCASNLIDWLRDYADRRIHSRLIDERRCIPPYVVLDFGNRGLLGMQVAAEDGGKLALSTFDTLRVQRQLGAIDLTLAFFVGLNNALGIRPIQKFGSPGIRERYLPDLAAGRMLAAFALTERDAGSNPLNMASAAGCRGDGCYVLNGEKIWTGSASWAGVVNVFARLAAGGGRDAGHMAFCLPLDRGGVSQGPEALTMGLRGMVQNGVAFDAVVVEEEDVLGKPGAGLAVAADAMMLGRLGIAATCVGAMLRALQLLSRYARRRHVNAAPLSDNDLVRAQIASLASAALVAGETVDALAAHIDAGTHVPNEAYACVKAACSEWLWGAADRLVQVLGGRGYIETNCAAQLLRDARIARLFEGPTETLYVFVGKRVLEGSPAYFHYLEHALGGKPLAEELRGALDGLARRFERDGHQRAEVENRLAYLAGELAALYLAYACSRTLPPFAREWLRGRIDSVPLGRGPRARMTGLERGALDQAIARQIGDLEQTLPGEDVQLDAYLRKSWPLQNAGAS